MTNKNNKKLVKIIKIRIGSKMIRDDSAVSIHLEEFWAEFLAIHYLVIISFRQRNGKSHSGDNSAESFNHGPCSEHKPAQPESSLVSQKGFGDLHKHPKEERSARQQVELASSRLLKQHQVQFLLPSFALMEIRRQKCSSEIGEVNQSGVGLYEHLIKFEKDGDTSPVLVSQVE